MSGIPLTRSHGGESVSARDVTAVLVTYGSRWHLLAEAIGAAKAAGAKDVIVVSNGARVDVAKLARERFGDYVEVVNLKRNGGSAAGYQSAFAEVIRAGDEFVLLLDDDNVIACDSLRTLCEQYDAHVESIGRADLVVVGFRPERQLEAATAGPRDPTRRRRSSVLGFSVIDVPAKLWRHLAGLRLRSSAMTPAPVVRIKECAYGGMLFHTDVIRKFGVPDEKLVLYADDTEYSGRISRGGGSILLVRDALIRDSEPSWNTAGRYSNSLTMLLRSEGDSRVYYSVRNNVYLATHVWSANRVLRWLNRQVFVALLWIGSKVLRRSDRYRLLRRAIVDGEKGALGICPEFPLP